MEHTDTYHRHHGSRRSGAREVIDAVGVLTTSMADAVDSFMGAIAPQVEQVRRRRHRRRFDHHSCCDDEPCRGCGDSCACDCCIGDADLVVYARAGERRVVPVRIENTRAREREISLTLSEFNTTGGSDSPVEARLIGDTAFTLQPCEEREVVILIGVGDFDPGDRKGDRAKVGDVDQCHVAVGDLRIAGCDLRPVRVAVAVLPRTCGPYEIECGCGCC